jgi:hypothetical protein
MGIDCALDSSKPVCLELSLELRIGMQMSCDQPGLPWTHSFEKPLEQLEICSALGNIRCLHRGFMDLVFVENIQKLRNPDLVSKRPSRGPES